VGATVRCSVASVDGEWTDWWSFGEGNGRINTEASWLTVLNLLVLFWRLVVWLEGIVFAEKPFCVI
jgi:hypothetical protein